MKASLRRKLAQIIKGNRIILLLYNTFYKLINKRSFDKQIIRRECLTIFDYQENALEMPYYPNELIKDSNFYGHAYWLKKYSGCGELKANVEHGIYLGDRITDDEFLCTTQRVITMSVLRTNILKILNKPTLSVGPYIHYADPYYNKSKYDELKDELGRVLLVFPFHSTTISTASFDIDCLIKEIENRKSNYNTVMVCLHYMDIIKNNHYTNKYISNGYKVVCAGHRLDRLFLSRLKSIIQLADYAISNSIGTQVGYCTYLGVCQSIIDGSSGIEACKSSVGSEYNATTAELAQMQTLEIMDAFSEYFYPSITQKQLDVVEKYWGLSQIKSPQELCEAINSMLS